MTERRLVLFLDSGDTIIDEGTEIKDERGVVLKACPWPGAPEALRQLREMGFRLCMVADGFIQSFETVHHQLGLYDLFEQRIYSEAVGREKPDAAMFEAALAQMGLDRADCPRILMVGNNLSRDIKGANAMGMHSAFIDQSPRYPRESRDPQAQPEFIIHSLDELIPLAQKLDQQLGDL